LTPQANKSEPKTGHPPEAPTSQQDRTTLYHLLILAAATFAFYARALWNGFVADDNSELLTNHAIRHLSNIPSFFTHGVWFFAGARNDLYYRPLKFAAYSIEYAVFGLHAAPWHLVNILVQIAAAIAIYFLVRDLASGLSVAPKPLSTYCVVCSAAKRWCRARSVSPVAAKRPA
jgi:hypothetical protein